MRSSQSNGGSPEREPPRTGMPRAVSRSTTLRPVLPVPPRTSVVFVSCAFSVSMFSSFYAYPPLEIYGSAVWVGIGQRVERRVEVHPLGTVDLTLDPHR